MEKLNLDLGLKEYQFPGGVLVFNPSDPNVYDRFVKATDTIKAIEQEMKGKAATIGENDPESGEKSLAIMAEMDSRMKSTLNGVFGGSADFDKLMCGVNLVAVNSNGKMVINGLMDTLKPIMEGGVQKFMDAEVDTAKLNREQRRALQK